MESKNPRCHNCQFAGKQFKIDKLTHLHCLDVKQYPVEKHRNNEISAWETLRVFNNKCPNHEFKNQ